jgi:hypothetical protein
MLEALARIAKLAVEEGSVSAVAHDIAERAIEEVKK